MIEESTVVEAEVVDEQPARDFDKEAREMGWVPETEFKGPKEKWKPAQNFVEDGEKILPIVRSQLKREREEREREKADFAKRLERIEKVNKTTFEAQQRAHEAELARVRTEQRAAVAAGDEKEFDRLEKVRDGLEKSAPKIDEADKPLTPEQEFEAKKKAFIDENSWFDEDKDPDLYDWVVGRSQRIGNNHPTKTFEQVMAQTVADAKKQFPEKFGGKKPAGNGHSAVDSGGDFSAVFEKKGMAAKLPAEARKQAAIDIAAGRYKTEEAWAKVYFGQ